MAAVVTIDLGPALAKIRLAMKDFSEEIQRRATYNALNYVGGLSLTQVRRSLARQSGAPYGRVMRVTRGVRAHPGRLEYRIEASDKAMPLIDFAKARAGQQNVRANPWNKARRFPNTFAVPLGGSLQIVKRVKKHHGLKGPLGVKVVWGPIIPHELLRHDEATFRLIEEIVPQKLLPRLMHELEQAAIRAKAESGT